METKTIERLKDFLNSGTISAKATKVLLMVVALGSIAFVGAVAPNIFQIVRQFQAGKKFDKRRYANALSALTRGGFVYVKTSNNKTEIFLTKKGRKAVEKFSIETIQIPKPKRWNKKWIIVIFDIPVRFSKGRNAFRMHLKDWGFHQLQKSVWVFPYQCEKEILFVSDFYGITKYIEVMTVENLYSDSLLRRKFNLNT